MITINTKNNKRDNKKGRYVIEHQDLGAKPKKVSKVTIVVLIVVILAVAIALKMYFLGDLKDNKATANGIEKIDSNDTNNNSETNNKNDNKKHKKIQSDETQIKGINWKDFSKDTKAVLEIPGMLEYPVVQSDDNNYYLHRGLDKKYKYSGTLFIDYHNNSNFTDDNTIIYGHNMTSGRMFGSLKKYKSKQYMQEHKYFFVHTRGTGGLDDGTDDSFSPDDSFSSENTDTNNTSQNNSDTSKNNSNGYDEVLKYEIKNVCIVNLGSRIYTVQFGDNFTKEDYINSYHGLYGNALDKDKTICTLSTCTNFGRQRLVVQGSLISRKAEK